MGRLVRVAPAQGFKLRSVGFVDVEQRVIQGQPGHVGAGFHRGGLAHVAPDACPVHIAKDAFDEQRFHMAERVGHRAQFVPDQPVLQFAQPCRIDQRFGQVFVHLTRPASQKGQGALALTLSRAFWCGLTGEPQFRPNQGQQGTRSNADRIQLRLNKAVARMHLTRLHQTLPALHPLRVPPKVGHVVGKRTVHGFVVGIAQNTPVGRDKFRVGRKGQHALPAVAFNPAGGWNAPLTLVLGVAPWHDANGFKRDVFPIHQRQVLGRCDIAIRGCDGLFHGLCLHQVNRRRKRGVFARQQGPADRRHMPLRGDRAKIVMRARQHRAIVCPAHHNRDRG